MFQLEQRGAMNAQAELDPAAVAVAVGADADAGASAGAERDDGSGGRPCPVFISADGTVAVNGEIIASAASGDAAQTAVLDHLQQRALALATPVEASVLDQQRRIVLRIRVREDGASERSRTRSPWTWPTRRPCRARHRHIRRPRPPRRIRVPRPRR